MFLLQFFLLSDSFTAKKRFSHYIIVVECVCERREKTNIAQAKLLHEVECMVVYTSALKRVGTLP